MKKGIRLFTVILTSIGIFAFCFLVYSLIRDMTPPEVTLTPRLETISTALPMQVTATDSKSGIKHISILAEFSGKSIPVLETDFTTNAATQTVTFSLSDIQIKTGTIELTVSATDGARFGFGNTSSEKITLNVDNTPPKITVKTAPPNIRRGGSAVILYSVNKPISQTGIKVGSLFFPGFKQENGDFLCFFAYPFNATNDTFQPQLVAVDIAGNVQAAPVAVNKMFVEFKHDIINVTPNFLNRKADEFMKIAPGDMPVLDRFIAVNRNARQSNAQTLLQLGKNTAPSMLWKNSFLALPKGAVKALFAEHRSYMWEGALIDEQTHLGYDLASTAQAPVPAANAGKIVFADYLGIYGNLVVIDHGLGLQSLYSHLSSIAVDVGKEVTRGETIGHTGSSGIALGDHLHFGILLSGLEVSPLEWLDLRWIRHNIALRIKEAGGTLPAFQAITEQSATPVAPAANTAPAKKKQATPAKKKKQKRQ